MEGPTLDLKPPADGHVSALEPDSPAPDET